MQNNINSTYKLIQVFWSFVSFVSKKFYLYLFIILPILFSVSCSKEEQVLDLDNNYLSVSDLLQYCQGSCDETMEWENKDALVKGYIMSIEDDSVMTDYYNESRVFLQDIRNGMYMEIRVTENKNPVFEKISTANKLSLFYIKGETISVNAQKDTECIKGVILELSNPDDINFE